MQPIASPSSASALPTVSTCRHCGHTEDTCSSLDISPPPTSQRIKELLQNNIPPLDSELHELSETALTICRSYADLDDEIKALEHRLASLQTKKDALGKEVTKYRTVTSPVRRLPADILCEIFQWNVEDDVSTIEFFSSLDIHSGPWLPTYVCRRWRDVALSYSKIWSSISVKLPAFNARDRRRATSCSFLLGLQLARSSTQPLGVRVEYDDFIYELDNYHPIIVALVPSSYRWKDLVVGMPQNAFGALSALSHILPNLRFADIRPRFNPADIDMFHDVLPYPVEFLEDIPEMRELQLADIEDPLEELPAINWGSIRRIDLWKSGRKTLHTTLTALRTLLHDAEKLEELFIEGVDIADHPSDAGVPPIRMEHLHSIGSYDSMHHAHSAGVDIWSLISAPKLESVTIVDDYWSMISVASMVKRSECRILNLEIRLSDHFVASEAFMLFATLPDLTSLTISPRSDAEALDALVKMLTVRSSSQIPLPNLKKLSIETEVFCEPSDFVELICSRNLLPLAQGVAKLKEVELNAKLAFPESRDRLKLKRCADMGFTLLNGAD